MSPSPPHPPADDPRAFVGRLAADLRQLAARAARRQAGDASSLCNAALLRVLDRMYGAFDQHRDGCRSFCRRIFAVAVHDELVERTRKRAARKYGGAFRQQPFDAVAGEVADRHDPLTDFADALDAVRAADPVRAEIVTMRAVGGYGFGEIAAELGLDESTVRKQFRLAQARLWRVFGPGGGP